MPFGRRAQPSRCFFRLLIPGLTLVLVLESQAKFEYVTLCADTEYDHRRIYSLCL